MDAASGFDLSAGTNRRPKFRPVTGDCRLGGVEASREADELKRHAALPALDANVCAVGGDRVTLAVGQPGDVHGGLECGVVAH